MRYAFTSLLCHRDVEIFKFNWFCMRAHLDHGFDILHIIVSDGSLTEEDVATLEALPNVSVEEDPIEILTGSDGKSVPKAPLLGKLQCHKRCFDNHDVDRAILFDCDIFFFNNWESDLRKILTERAVVLRDWGGSLGPNGEQYTKLFGVYQDETTTNCNTGVIGLNKEDYYLVEEKIDLHLKDTFMIMEDQGIIFAAFYGNLTYVNGIKCVINGAENRFDMWPHFLRQNAIHLMGMRTRPEGLKQSIDHSLKSLPTILPLRNFTPIEKNVSWGLLEFGHYSFKARLQKIPSTVDGKYVNEAMYLHGGSSLKWKLPDRLNRFTTQFVCMDTGIKENVRPAVINGKEYTLGEEIDIELNGSLEISTQHGPGTHLAFIKPRLWVDKETWPDLTTQLGVKR
jgi:hypothetical protein